MQANDFRFENSHKAVKLEGLPKWGFQDAKKQKIKDFNLPDYCRNGSYKPNISLTMNSADVLSKFLLLITSFVDYEFNRTFGRDSLFDRHYITATNGAGCHLDVQRVKNAD